MVVSQKVTNWITADKLRQIEKIVLKIESMQNNLEHMLYFVGLIAIMFPSNIITKDVATLMELARNII